MKVKISLLAVLTSGLAVCATAQSTPPSGTTATPLATAPQPAPSPPAPTTSGEPVVDDAWQAFMAHYYDLYKVPKVLIIRLGDNLAYPQQYMKNAPMLIVEEDDHAVYLRNLPIEDPRSASHKAWLLHEVGEAHDIARAEQLATKLILEPEEVVPPPPFTDRLRLADKSKGLPEGGRWLTGFAVADLDRDGRLDVVLPPPRLGDGIPSIYLNRPDGWQKWAAAVWPKDVKLDYGDVKVADFDGDGHLDIAIACHFLRSYVLYGNGEGDFTRYAVLPRASSTMTSRALAVADFNGDGRPDIVQLAELDLDMSTSKVISSGLLAVDINTPAGWRLSPATFPPQIYGDHVTAGDFNGDGAIDILAATHKIGGLSFIFLNDGNGESFTPVTSDKLPYQSYVFGVAAGKLHKGSADELVLAFQQSVRALKASNTVHGLAVYRLSGSGKDAQLAGTVIARDPETYGGYSCAAVADVDGDGRLDIIAGRRGGRLEIYLQAGDGSFLQERSPELDLGDAMINDLIVKDLDGDGRAEILIMASPGSTTKGFVRCYGVQPPLDKQRGRR